MFDDPKTAIGVVNDGDGLAFGGRDFVIASLEVDGVVMVDSARRAQREMKIQKSRQGTGAERATFLREGFLPNLDWHLARAAVGSVILPGFSPFEEPHRPESNLELWREP